MLIDKLISENKELTDIAKVENEFNKFPNLRNEIKINPTDITPNTNKNKAKSNLAQFKVSKRAPNSGNYEVSNFRIFTQRSKIINEDNVQRIVVLNPF